jgi:hypothetical protein
MVPEVEVEVGTGWNWMELDGTGWNWMELEGTGGNWRDGGRLCKLCKSLKTGERRGISSGIPALKGSEVA